MSHYGFIAFIEDGTLRPYLDRGASHWMQPVTMHEGPRALLNYTRAFDLMDVSQIIDWYCWSEATMVVDFDHSVLVWTDVSGLHPGTVQALIERTAPDWTSLWSPGDWDGHLAYLRSRGFTLESPASPSASAPPPPPAITTPGPPPGAEYNEIIVVTAALPVRHYIADAVAVPAWQTAPGIAAVASYSPEAVLAMASQLAHAPAIKDPSLRWGYDFIGDWVYPSGGVHIEPAQQTVDWWSVTGVDDGQDEFARNWPGYTVRSHSDDDSWHRARCGLGQICSDALENVDEYFGDDDPLYGLVAELLHDRGGAKNFPPSACILNDGQIVVPTGLPTT